VSPLPCTGNETQAVANTLPAENDTVFAAGDVTFPTPDTLSKAEDNISAAEMESTPPDEPVLLQKIPLVCPKEDLSSTFSERRRRKKHRRHVRAPRIQTLKAPSWVMMWTWALFLLVLWLVSPEGVGVTRKEEDWTQTGLQCILFLAGGLAVACKAFMGHWLRVRQ